MDEECINALLTLEHLSLVCQTAPVGKNGDIVYGQSYTGIKWNESNDAKGKHFGPSIKMNNENGIHLIDDRIHSMHFSFDVLNILPKCQQAEVLFSMFSNGLQN